MTTLHETDFLRISLHSTLQILEVEWLDFSCGADFRDGILAALRLGRQHGVRGWIGNNRLMRAIRADDQAWYQAEAQPLLLALPQLRCAALVESEDAMNRMAMADIERGLPMELVMPHRAFLTVGEARLWVKNTLAAVQGGI